MPLCVVMIDILLDESLIPVPISRQKVHDFSGVPAHSVCSNESFLPGVE